ncbi:MAG: FkbM family methyltransferase [Rhizomicrobium sp.]
MESDRYLTASNQFGTYCVPASSMHRVAASIVLSGRVWESRTINFMMANCGTGDIIHAGAYFGDFLPALSHAVNRSAFVWAFEPNTENFYCATKTVELNGLENIRLTNSALGARTENMLLKVRGTDGRASGGVSRLVHKQKPGAGYEDVKVIAGDDVVPSDRAVSILQLDVEGFELDALAGLVGTIRRCMPIIILERVPPEVWFQENILTLGYEFRGQVHANSIFATAGTQLVAPFRKIRDGDAAAEPPATRRQAR